MSEQTAFYAEKNRSELGPRSDALRWLTAADMADAEKERARLLAGLSTQVDWAYGNTKPHYGPLSPGCARCGEGSWSCLFVNGRCNANCFFCPTSQDRIGDPNTSTLTFRRPRDYADYLRKGRFRGVAFSGGEPLLTLERTVEFARTLRESFGDDLYIWVYTNGLLMSREKAARLRDAGVNEVRFNLHAAGYSVRALQSAVRVVPTVTVEIPAVPEEEERLLRLLPVLSKLGVKHLNLHQLRCTPHNLESLLRRPYRFVRGPRVTVLESEFLALRLLGHVAREALSLAVQYCAFAFKNPHQTMGARRRWAPFVKTPWEDITTTGAIRTVYITGGDEHLATVQARLLTAGLPSASLKVDGRRGRLYAPLRNLSDLSIRNLRIQVEYSAAVLVGAPTYHFPPTRLEVNDRFSATVERRLLSPPLGIAVPAVRELVDLASGTDSPATLPALSAFVPFECLPTGLAPYA